MNSVKHGDQPLAHSRSGNVRGAAVVTVAVQCNALKDEGRIGRTVSFLCVGALLTPASPAFRSSS